MRFHTRHPSASYFGRRSQARILRMVGMLVLVMIAVKVAGRASFWEWMFPNEQNGAAAQPAEQPEALDEESFIVKLDDEHRLAPGEFVVPPDPPLAAGTAAAQAGTAAAPVEAVDSSESEAIAFEPGLLAPVRDNTLNIRRDELEAYYAVLARARDLPAGTLEKLADPHVSFAVLMNQSPQFRGKPITVRGEIRRLMPFVAGENEHDIRDLWEAWLFTDESGLNPYRIVCTEIPPGIPRGEELQNAVPVRVTGFFFKKEGYSARGGLHTAPLLLARTIRWLPPPPVRESRVGAFGPWIVALVCLTAAGLAFTCWRISAGDRASQRRSFHRYYEPRPEALAALKGLETSDESDLFRHLAEENGRPASEENRATRQPDAGA